MGHVKALYLTKINDLHGLPPTYLSYYGRILIQSNFRVGNPDETELY